MFYDGVRKNSVYKKMTSGIDFYYIPMENYSEKMVAVVVKSGGNAVDFLGNKNKDEINFPYGTAHFLEHKMFRQKWGDAFSTFVKNGAMANAFTDATKTVYYFKCQENFGKNTKLLLDMIQSPYFVEEEIGNERSIIEREIALYDDEPSWCAYYEMLGAMYKNHPVKVPIAGSKKSITNIDKKVLEESFSVLYPTNKMSIICVGDISLDFMMKEIKKIPKKYTNYIEKYEPEPERVLKEYTEINFGLTRSIYQIGMKLVPEESRNFWEEIIMIIAIDIWIGESSDFYEIALEKNYIDEPLGFGYFSGEGFGFVAFSGVGEYYEEVLKLMKIEYKKIIENGIMQRHFQRIRKKQIGKYLKTNQSVLQFGLAQVEWAMNRMTPEEVFATIKKIRLKDIRHVFKNVLDIDNMTVSVVK